MSRMTNPESNFASNLDDDAGIDALLADKGYDPLCMLTRKETEAMFAAFGVRFKASTMGRFASTGDDGPPYQILFGRALMWPRESLRWAFSRASAARRSPPPELRRPRDTMSQTTNPENSPYATARDAVFTAIDGLPDHLRKMLLQEVMLKYGWGTNSRRRAGAGVKK